MVIWPVTISVPCTITPPRIVRSPERTNTPSGFEADGRRVVFSSVPLSVVA